MDVNMSDEKESTAEVGCASGGSKKRRCEHIETKSSYDFSTSPLQKLLRCDTDELAARALENEAELSDLDDFSSRLQASIAALKKAISDKKREEKTKQRQLLVSEHRCFDCNTVSEELVPCVDFTHHGGVLGDGVLWCKDCVKKSNVPSCSDCTSLLCCDANMGDPNSRKTSSNSSFACKFCENIFCSPCAAKMKWHGESMHFYCNACADAIIETMGDLEITRCKAECNETTAGASNQSSHSYVSDLEDDD